MIHVTNKLARDNIPDIIKAKNGSCEVEILDDEAFQIALIEKLKEEVSEFEKDKNLEELADIYEVYTTILMTKGLSLSDVQSAAAKKRKKNGGFSRKLFMKSYNERGILRSATPCLKAGACESPD